MLQDAAITLGITDSALADRLPENGVLLHWLRENVTGEERSSVTLFTSINFDVSVADMGRPISRFPSQ